MIVPAMKKHDAIRHYGSQQKLADALGISQPSVANWGEFVPLQHARRLAEMTQGALRFDPKLYQQIESARRQAMRDAVSRAWREGRMRKDHATAKRAKERSRHE